MRYLILSDVTMKTAVFWNAVICILTHSYQRFWGKYFLLLLLKIEATCSSEPAQSFPSLTQPKTVHNLSFIQNDIKITSIATYFGLTWSSSGNCSLIETVALPLIVSQYIPFNCISCLTLKCVCLTMTTLSSFRVVFLLRRPCLCPLMCLFSLIGI
jgi:hypothetical protein